MEYREKELHLGATFLDSISMQCSRVTISDLLSPRVVTPVCVRQVFIVISVMSHYAVWVFFCPASEVGIRYQLSLRALRSSVDFLRGVDSSQRSISPQTASPCHYSQCD